MRPVRHGILVFSLSLRERVGVRGRERTRRSRPAAPPHPCPLPEGEGGRASTLRTRAETKRPFRSLVLALTLALLCTAAEAAAPNEGNKGGRDHWACKAPVRPAVPDVKNSSWVRNPLDAFVAAEHARRGLTPRPEAPKHVLLRRVYLDLTGLPPTREQLHAFLADPSPDAYEKVV